MSDAAVKIPGFEIVDLIGHGGMASVWKARQLSLDRLVAIKVLSPRYQTDPADTDRFQSEAKAAARLKHPGIVQVYDAGTQEGVYYFVMEYVAGYTVGDWLRRKGVLDEADALVVAECVTDALDYAWTQAQVIHCDIKPDNIIIDADGTVKVADLGLARTLSAMTRKPEESDEVMGTPAYMAPEQAMGEPDMDCRVDMYALGAMLYHLVTGRRLFESLPEQEVMEKQCTDQVEHPYDLNQRLSWGLCQLIEKLLSKDRRYREKDWSAVKSDIARVKRGHSPHGVLPPSAVSTVRKCTRTHHHMKAAAVQAGSMARPAESSPVLAAVLIAVFLVFAALAAYWFVSSHQAAAPGGRTQVVPQPVPAPALQPAPPVSPPPASGGAAEAACREALAWVEGHPGGVREGLRRLHAVRALSKGTVCQVPVEEAIVRLNAASRRAAVEAMAKPTAQATPLLSQGRYEEAAAVYESYSGALADETRPARADAAAGIRRQKADAAAAADRSRQNQAQAYATMLSRLADEVLAGDAAKAAATATAAAQSGRFTGQEAELAALRKTLADAAAVDTRVLDSFREQQGREVTVQLASGSCTLTVTAVSDREVTGAQSSAAPGGAVKRPISFTVRDLALRERLLRMGPDEQPAVALVKGAMAWQSKAFTHARRYFLLTDPQLSKVLIERLDAAEKAAPPAPTTAVPAAGETQTVAAVHGPSQPPRRAPLTHELEAVKDNIRGVEALMFKRNPKLTALEMTIDTDDEGMARAVSISSSATADVGPLAALTTLKEFSYEPPHGEDGLLRDIDGLQGLPLESIRLVRCRLADLTCLRGMPVRVLVLAGTKVRDLAPLRGLPLEKLDISDSSVMDISALSGLQLRYLNISRTPVRRLQALKSMPLEEFVADGCGTQDFTWLPSMKLRSLSLGGTALRSLDDLAGMPLASLSIPDTEVASLAPIAALPLRSLIVAGCPVTDFSPLKGMKLVRLDVARTRFSDGLVLAGMPLTELILDGTSIRDLGPLAALPIEFLSVENTGVADVKPLRDMPLTGFRCRASRVADFSPLRGSGIVNLWLDGSESRAPFLSSLPSLEYVNGSFVEAETSAEGVPGAHAKRRRKGGN